jgi:hypothetical protein
MSDFTIRQHLPPERTPRTPRLSPNRVVGKNLPRILRQQRRCSRAARRDEYVGSLPGQRNGLKLRECGCVFERRGIAREQQVNAGVQKVSRIARSNEKPDGREVVALEGNHGGSDCVRRDVFRCDTTGSCPQRPAGIGC